MFLPHALLLGIVEGITEFLPISSTAHLIIASKLLGIPSTAALTSFEIIIQLGAISAVLVLYFQKVFQKKQLIIPVIVSFIPTMILGLLLYKIVKEVFLETFTITIVGLFIGGMYLVLIEYLTRSKQVTVQLIEVLPPLKSIMIGVNQSLAMIPGMSRSAMTITAGKLAGLSRDNAVELSFLMAVPVMASAAALDIYKSHQLISQSDWVFIFIGYTSAFITAMLSMKWFIRFAKSHSLAIFGWYRIILAIVLAIFARS